MIRVHVTVKSWGMFGFLDALHSKDGCLAYTQVLLLEFLFAFPIVENQ